MNTSINSTFEKGFSFDLENNLEQTNSAQKLINGRIYSKDGRYSFAAIQGTKVEYENPNIVKYLGSHSFRNEFLAFCKILKTEDLPTETIIIETFNIVTNNFIVESLTNTINIINELSDNSVFETETITETVVSQDPNNFQINFSCENDNNQEINLSEYYKKYIPNLNFEVCSSNNTNIPPNNVEYYDAFYLFKKDENGNLNGTLIWYGYQNWPLNSKITTEGVEENQFYKRVYYTDAFNVRKVMNIKDKSIAYRGGEEFNQILDNVLLQPEVTSIVNGGQLKAMKVFYVYRIVSQNGQVSNFSPASSFEDIIKEDNAIKYRGGDISENTQKKVNLKCNILNLENSSEIECFAVEYEAQGAPTGIKRLGLKPAQSVVFFEHLGNEPISSSVVFDDVVQSNNIWKYCNDFYSEKNKLVAVGLRNDPLPTIFNQLDYLLPLHSWNKDGNTHTCLYNPEPWNYNKIDPSNTESLYSIQKKLYSTISVFGPTTINFSNSNTGDSIEIIFSDLPIDRYTDITNEILTWLLFEQDNNLNWEAYFPNLVISESLEQILFAPIDSLIQTNMELYSFSSSNGQFIEEIENNLIFLEPTVNVNNLVNGAQSLGFNEGTGIRITYREFKEPVLNQATDVYNGSDNLLDYETPLKTLYAMKGEIYRLGFNAFNNDSTNLFTVPLGDIMVPNIGDIKTEIDDAGNSVITSEKYVNQSVENGILYAHGIKLHIEVRLSCDLKKFIPMFQLMNVERTEENRTILCQGIAAPLMRVQHNDLPQNKLPEPLLDKWCLPYYGGPVYEKSGFEAYDEDGEDNQEDGGYDGISRFKRVMQHRALMYFDSPDLYYNKVSSAAIEDSIIDIRGKLKTDHTSNIIMNRGTSFAEMFDAMFTDAPGYFIGEEIYPKFSRKIKEVEIDGIENIEDLPNATNTDSGGNTFRGYFINMSVYSNFQHYSNSIQINKAREMLRGEVISGQAFDVFNGISNNALCLPYQPWFFGGEQRRWDYASNDPTRVETSIFGAGVTSVGYKSVFIKTETDLFTDEFVGPWLPKVKAQIYRGSRTFDVNDTLPLININKGNRVSVYGGRSREAYTRNTYIPFTKSIPVEKSSNAVQYFDAGIDTYTSLNVRLKNDYSDEEQSVVGVRNHEEGRARGSFDVRKYPGAWMYVVILETQVEPKMNYDFENYKVSPPHIFNKPRTETINPAYFNVNNSKSFVVKPFKYRDDPNQINEIAVSDVKVAGEPYDSWTSFKINNFYDLLDKNKGAITNIDKFKDQIFVTQEQQTSIILLGVDRLVTDNEGNPINVKQGSGSVVEGHRVISEYGTSIRRALSRSEYGISFYDERKNEFIKIDQPLFFKNGLSLNYLEKFKNNPVVDTESYYDAENKETNINLKTKNGDTYLVSYNEADQVFNGEFEMDSNLFIEFDNNIFSPRLNTTPVLESTQLHKLSYGDFVNIFGVLKKLKIGVHVNGNINNVLQHRNINLITNLDYPVEKIKISSNIMPERIISDRHPWYKIREGIHSVPMVNQTKDISQSGMIRGSWIYLDFTIDIRENKNVKVTSIIHNVRLSHK